MMPGEKIRIALIDDDEDDFLLISDFIKDIDNKEFIIDWYNDYDTAFETIRSKSYHIYFVDYFLGAKTGLDLLKQAADIKFDRPIILLTGFGSKDVDLKAMEYGATDYLVKSDLSTEKLERCIRYSLERRAFLDELRTRETRYRNLFEGSKDAVFIADTDLSFKEVNPSAHLLLDTQSGTFTNRSLYEFINDDVQKARIRDLVKTAGKIDDLEITLKKDNQEVRTCLLSLYILQQQVGPNIVHGIIHDITNIRKAEMANLLTEKMQANERLVRILAHEIRNPLNNIILSVEHLLRENENSADQNLLKIIDRNSIRINNIISELLGMANPGELVFEPYTLQEILEESLAQASDRITLHNINVSKQFPQGPLLIMADKNKMVIALTNILINAVEAMANSKGSLSVMLDDGPGNYTISIKDNGKGIPKEYMSKLFEPLFTLKKNGMGLGLTASYSIIQAHKGNIQVESMEDQGTKFMISLNKHVGSTN